MAVEIRINAKNVTRSVSYEQTILPLRLAESTVKKTSEKRKVQDVRKVNDFPLSFGTVPDLPLDGNER